MKGGEYEFNGIMGFSHVTGSKNAIQAIGSTVSYLCRYTLLCVTGLATSDPDDDGFLLRHHPNSESIV